MLQKAIKFATKKHDGQYRQGIKKIPYIVHPLSVLKLVKEAGGSIEAQIAAVLHDTLEDTNTTKEELIDLFGETVTKIVVEVTDDKNKVYERFLNLIGHDHALSVINNKRLLTREFKVQQALDMPNKSLEARLIKLADKVDNIRSIIEEPPKWSTASIKGYIEASSRVVEAGEGSNKYLEDLFKKYTKKLSSKYGSNVKHSSWVAIKHGDEYLLAQRGLGVKNPGLWNFFGGRIDEGETAIDSAIRELQEEAGIVAFRENLTEIGNLIFPEDVIYLFVFEVESKIDPVLNEESLTAKWININDLKEMTGKLHKPTFHFIKNFF